MKTNRNTRKNPVIAWIAAALITAFAPVAATAQEFPQPGKAVRIMNPFPPGGTADTLSRALAARLTIQLGVPVIVENKPGASTLVAVRELIKAAPDGHTILYTVTGTTSQLPHLYNKPPYDPFTAFTPLGLAAYNKLVLMAASTARFNSMKELIEFAKANPGAVSYASYGNGSFPHVVSEQLKRVAGIDMLHVPFKGASDAGRAVMAGDVQILFDAPLSAIGAAQSGKVKLLAVVSALRIAMIKDVPTMAETGLPGFDAPGLEQLLGPPGMTPALIRKVNAELVKALRSPEVFDLYNKFGLDFVASSAEEHARIMRENHALWGEIIRRVGVKLD